MALLSKTKPLQLWYEISLLGIRTLLMPLQGSFTWPSLEFPPERELGTFNFELLNQIRHECFCHISYDAARSSFIVKGKNAKALREALMRIRGVLCEIVARSNSAQRTYLLLNDCKEVHLREYAHPSIVQTGMPRESGMGKIIQSTGAKKKPDRLRPTAQEMKNTTIQTLNKIRGYRGNLIMRAHLGVLCLKQYRMPGGRSSLQDYKGMINDPNFEAIITEE